MVSQIRKETASRTTPWTMEELKKLIPQPLTNKSKWKIKTSHNGGKARNLADGKMEPRWDSATSMKSGMWVTVELPSSTNINSVRLDCSGSNGDYPRGYKLFISQDGKSWKEVAKGNGKSPVVDINFSAVKAKHIKVELTKGNRLYWSIHEMDIFQKF